MPKILNYVARGRSKPYSTPRRLVSAEEDDHNPLTANKKLLNISKLNTRTLRTQESLLELAEALKDLGCTRN